MFNRDNEKIANENIILKERPNLFFSCKKIFVLLIFLGAMYYLSPIALDYIVQIQGQLINVVILPIVQIATWIIFIIILSIIIWIIWTLVSWTAKEYTISDQRITYKTGVLFTKINHMPYSKVQDVVVSQGLIGRLLSVGTITTYSGYDGSNLELENISKPNKVEKTIFEEINKSHSHYPNQSAMNSNDFVNGPNSSYPRYDNGFNRPDNNYNNSYNNHDPNFNNYNNSNYNHNHHDNNNQYQNNNVNQNLKHKIKDNYNQSSHEEDPKRIYGPITNVDFPFLKKDEAGNNSNNRHNVNDFVENPENYQNSLTFLDNSDKNEIKNESDYDKNYSNENRQRVDGNGYVSDDYLDSNNEDNNRNMNINNIIANEDRYTDDGYVDGNDYFDKTMDQIITKLDGDIKFKNTNKMDFVFDLYNQNQEQNINHDQNNNYNNNNNSTYNNYNQNNYNRNDNRNINNNSNINQGDSQNINNDPNNDIKNNHINNNVNDNFNNNNSINGSKNKEDKSKDVLERHFKKFRK